MEYICLIARWFADLFSLVVAEPAAENIFGFSDYLTVLALLAVVFTTSDFRYRYRLNTDGLSIAFWGYWIAAATGVAILFTDIWFQDKRLIPYIFSNQMYMKAGIGLCFSTFTLAAIYRAYFSPPKFSRLNAEEFYKYHYHLIHEGNPEKLLIVAEELNRSVEAIMDAASKVPPRRWREAAADQTVSTTSACAHDFLLLIADQRFCRLIVEKVPIFALAVFQAAQDRSEVNFPIFQFARNIGQEFIRNTGSLFYQEDSGYYSGVVGYDRNVTRIVFSNFRFVEQCASDGASPLDTDYRERKNFDEIQLGGYMRAGTAVFEAYLADKQHHFFHSYTLARFFHSLEGMVVGAYEIDGLVSYYELPAFRRLSAVADFLKDLVRAFDKHDLELPPLKGIERRDFHVLEYTANTILDAILAASSVTQPVWTCWSVQHNTVWTIFDHSEGRARKWVGARVRRLIYEEIKRMDRWPNFKGARLIGYCLNVLGLTLSVQRNDYFREFYPLQVLVLRWVKKNYERMTIKHPKVAAAMLQGGVTFDVQTRSLVRTLRNDLDTDLREQRLPIETSNRQKAAAKQSSAAPAPTRAGSRRSPKRKADLSSP